MPQLREGYPGCGMSVWNCVFECMVDGCANGGIISPKAFDLGCRGSWGSSSAGSDGTPWVRVHSGVPEAALRLRCGPGHGVVRALTPASLSEMTSCTFLRS